MRNVTRTFVMAAVGVMMTATAATAQSKLNFVGSVDVDGTSPTTLRLDFNPFILASPTVGAPFSGTITPFVTTGTINDVNTTTAGCVGCPVNPFFTIGGYTFTLTSTPLAPAGPFNFGPIQLTQSATGTSATFSALGGVTGPGLVAGTNYTGIFTAQFSGETPEQVFASINNSGTTRTVGFSAEITTLSTVPEPSTYVLLATGVGALGMVARRRRTNV
jgi:hypothetical protein